jgi:hypothetical protein
MGSRLSGVLDTLPVGRTVREVIEPILRETPGADPAPKAFGDILARRMAADLLPVMSDYKPDLVVYEVFNPGAGIAAALAGVPAVCHGIGRVEADPTWQATRDTWMHTAEDLGIDTRSRLPDFFGNTYLDICPPSLQRPDIVALSNREVMRPIAWNAESSLPPVVVRRDSGRSLVLLTFGTAFARTDLMREAIEGLSALDVDVIAALGPRVERAAVGDVPSNVTAEEWSLKQICFRTST